jgi:hypothetical protein
MSTLAIVIFVVMALFLLGSYPGITSAILPPLFDTCRELPRAQHFLASLCF